MPPGCSLGRPTPRARRTRAPSHRDPRAGAGSVRTLGRWAGVSRDDLLNVAGAAGQRRLHRPAALRAAHRRCPARSGSSSSRYAIFLVTYAFLVSLTEERPVVVDKVMTVLFASAAALAGLALFSVISFTLWRGRTALVKTNLYWQDMSAAGPSDPLSVGGISHAIVGTL